MANARRAKRLAELHARQEAERPIEAPEVTDAKPKYKKGDPKPTLAGCFYDGQFWPSTSSQQDLEAWEEAQKSPRVSVCVHRCDSAARTALPESPRSTHQR